MKLLFDGCFDRLFVGIVVDAKGKVGQQKPDDGGQEHQQVHVFDHAANAHDHHKHAAENKKLDGFADDLADILFDGCVFHDR